MKTPASLLCDFYKISHREQYPKETQVVYSTWTPRSNKHHPTTDKVVVFGIQAAILKYLIHYFDEEFFEKEREEVISEYERVLKFALGIKTPDCRHISDLHELGYLPLKIRAIPEGMRVPLRVPMMTIENTDPRFFWLTNFVETMLSAELWLPSTSATIAKEYRDILDRYAEETGDPNFVGFQGHDFSMRGMACIEAAASSGAGHLLSFYGTDTIPAIFHLEEYYDADIEKELVGTSIPATEHSVMCAGIGSSNEYDTYERLITEVYPNGLISIVSDTMDLWACVKDIIMPLKEKIMTRDGKVVVRPDCYAEGTQILTDKGFVDFREITEDSLVAQVDFDKTYSFCKPTKIQKYAYDGEMHRFESAGEQDKKHDILVTPNHRMIYFGKDNVEAVYAKDVPLGCKKPNKRTVLKAAKTKKDPTKRLSALERFLIALQADGCIRNKNRSEFNFSKDRKTNRFLNIATSNGFLITEHGAGSRNIDISKDPEKANWKSQRAFSIKHDSLDLRYEYHKEKFGWVDVGKLTYEWCVDFIDELVEWDGCKKAENRYKFDTMEKEVMDTVELIALSAGYRTKRNTYQDARDTVRLCYTISIIKDSDCITTQAINHSVELYSGDVYCCTVPSGMLIVKLGNSVSVCGNSGDPVKIMCGYRQDEIRSVPYGFVDNTTGKLISRREEKGLVECLWDIFGGTINEKGYKVLDPHIGAIYGDSINLSRCESICHELQLKGFASTNVVFGIGSYTYQYNTRDSFGFALKSTMCVIDNVERKIFKNPATDDGTKKSNCGVVAVSEFEGELVCTDGLYQGHHQPDIMRNVFLNGELMVRDSLATIRQRLSES